MKNKSPYLSSTCALLLLQQSKRVMIICKLHFQALKGNIYKVFQAFSLFSFMKQPYNLEEHHKKYSFDELENMLKMLPAL